MAEDVLARGRVVYIFDSLDDLFDTSLDNPGTQKNWAIL